MSDENLGQIHRLAEADVGSLACIGLDHTNPWIARLEHMGLCEDSRFELVAKGNPMIVRVGRTSIGVSAQLAKLIRVQRVDRYARRDSKPVQKAAHRSLSSGSFVVPNQVVIGPAELQSGRLERFLAIPQGCATDEYRSWSPTILQVQRGLCQLVYDDLTLQLGAGDSQLLRLNTPHRIVAVEDVHARLCFTA